MTADGTAPTGAYDASERWPQPGIYVRPLRRGKHHLLGAGFDSRGHWVGQTVCGRYVDRSTWEAQDGFGWAPEDGCRRCCPTTASAEGGESCG